MWTCPKCGEQIDDVFNACWKCAGAALPPSERPPRAKKPFQELETICLILAVVPGVVLAANARATNESQATFRIAVIVGSWVLGLGGYLAIKLYQRSK